jgi:cysteine desulfurase
VLEAMGHENAGALRVSIGAATGAEDLELFRQALARIAAHHAGRDKAA